MPHRFRTILFVVPLIALVIGALLAAIISLRMTPQYQSSAVIELVGGSSPAHIPTEMEALISYENLAFASHELDLVTRWGISHEESIGKLRKHIRIHRVTGTDLIEIRVLHPLNEDARDIAMSVVSAADYIRNQIHPEELELNRKELENAISEQESKVLDLRMQLAAENPHSPHPDSAEPSDVERRHQLENDLLMALMSKVVTIEDASSRRSNPKVILHDPPMIAAHPLFPNTRLNLIIGATVGLLTGIPLALAIMTILHRMRPPRMTDTNLHR